MFVLSRIVQLGFLTTAARFLRQAESLQDEKAEELLAHSLWCLSVNLTEIRSSTAPPSAINPVCEQSVLRIHDQDGKRSSVSGNKLGSSRVQDNDGKQQSSVSGNNVGSKRCVPRSGEPQETLGPHHPSSSRLTKVGQEEPSELTRSVTSLRSRTLSSDGPSTIVLGFDMSTESAAVFNEADGSGGARGAFGGSGARGLSEEGAFGLAREGGKRARDQGLGGM